MWQIDDPNDWITAYRYQSIAAMPFQISAAAGKISIIIFLIRTLYPAVSPFEVSGLQTLIILTIVMYTLGFLVCLDFASTPEETLRSGAQGNYLTPQAQEKAGMAVSGVNLLTDLTLALYPVSLVIKMQLTLRVKLGLIGSMGAGVFSSAAAMVKTYLLRNLHDSSDLTWKWAAIAIWWAAEMYIIIICASIPSLRQFYLATFNLKRPQSQPTALWPGSLLQPPVSDTNGPALQHENEKKEIHEDDAKKELHILSGDRHRLPHPVSESHPRSEVKEDETSFTHMRAITQESPALQENKSIDLGVR